MAGTIALKLSCDAKNGSFADKFAPQLITIVQTTQGGHRPTVIVAQAAESDMPFGSVVAPARICLINLDPTNYVTWGPKDAGVMVAMGRLVYNEPTTIMLSPGAILRWIAHTADCKVMAQILET